MAVVQKERSVPSGGVSAAVVGKFKSSEVKVPVMLVGRNISTQHVFNSAVCALFLTICLRVMRGGKVEAGAKEMIEVLPKVTSDSQVVKRGSRSEAMTERRPK